MAHSLGRLRHIAAGAIGVGSILAGLALAFRLVTPGLVEQLPTSELLGLLGLLTLPALALWALSADRNAAARIPGAIPEPARTDRMIEPKPLPHGGVPEAEVHAPGRRAVHHRRHDPARTAA